MNWRSYDDVIFFQGRIFTAANNANYHMFDYSVESGLSFIRSIPWPPRDAMGYQLKKHLVESCGKLLLVYRFCEWKKFNKYKQTRKPYKTWMFEVFKFNADVNLWDKVNSLGERLLFLGPNDSICVSAKEFPWCKPNCVYFTHDTWAAREEAGYQWDNGVFSLNEDRVIEKFDIPHSLSVWPAPAMWFRSKGL